MTIGWMIICAGVGTYLMRSAGIWMPANLVPTQWLTHLPLAVILVMTISSIYTLHGNPQSDMGAIAASSAVILASLKQLPLILCITIGCIVFGLFH